MIVSDIGMGKMEFVVISTYNDLLEVGHGDAASMIRGDLIMLLLK